MKQVADHNDAKWLAIKCIPGTGWVVVRTCPCHRRGVPSWATIPLETEKQAQRALTAMLAVSKRLGT